MTLDISPIIEFAGLKSGYSNLDIALRDSSDQVLFGDGSVFNSSPIFYKVVLPEGSWELAEMPAGGKNPSKSLCDYSRWLASSL